MPIVAAPKSLRDKLGDEALESFIQLLNEVEKGARETSILLVEERFERKLTEVKTDLENKIAEVKADLIKWMFIFWIGQVGTILGILALTGVFSK
jgi:hypothetical protein